MQVGSYSINTTKNGVGDFDITWNGTDDPNFTNYFNGEIAEKIIFWVRVSNADIALDTLTVKGYYSASNPAAYPITFTNDGAGWTFAADTWTKVEIDIRKDYATKQGRAYWSVISRFVLSFSGGGSGNEVYIDGLRLEIANPNPTSPYPNFYVFPSAIYLGACYFEDSGFVMVANALTGGGTLGSPFYAKAMPQCDLGSYLTGGVFYRNAFAESSGGNFIAYGDYTYNFIGLTFIWAVEQAYSFYLGYGSSCLAENINFYNVGDIQGGTTTTFKNIVVGNSRYPMRMGAVPILDDYTTYMPSTYGYVNILERPAVTMIGYKPVGFTGTTIYLNSRNYNLDADHTHNLVNLDLSESSGGKITLQIWGQNVPAGNVLTQNIYYTLNLKVIDKNGISINEAAVKMVDVNGDEAFSTTTDANGIISEQTIMTRYNSVTSNGVSTTTFTFSDPVPYP